DIEVTRQNGYTGPVTLDLLFRHLSAVCANPLPPGVSVLENQSKTQLEAKETKGWITLQAAPAAASVSHLPLAVLAQVRINQVLKIPYASEPLMLSVAAKK